MKQPDGVIIRTNKDESPLLWIVLAIALPTVIPGLLALITQL